jgi:flagellar FliL protein
MAAKPDNKASDKNEPPAKRGKILWISIAVVMLLACGIAAGWYFTRPAAAGTAAEEQASRKRSETVFVKLDPFTVNLADEGGERLAQVAIVLELVDKASEVTLAKSLPLVRNNLLLLLSSQHTTTLLTLDGKLALARDIVARAGSAMGWEQPPVEAEVAATATAAKAGNVAATRKVAANKPAAASRHPEQDNPVVAVHFSQLLVQ